MKKTNFGVYGKITSVILATLLLFGSALAQKSGEEIVVGGVVSYEVDNTPLVGATVVVKGGVTGATTSIDGSYNIKVKSGDILVFSYLGMKSKELPARSATLNVALDDDDVLMEAIVAIGYASMRKKEVTGATAHINSEKIEEFVSVDLAETLQGLVAGVSVSSDGGTPGSAANIQIRGVASMSDDGNAPLYVIDGVPQVDVPILNPNEIESLDILKDAASAAIYGTRGAGGVILITTKQGEAGKLKVNFNGTLSVSQIDYDGLPDLMNSHEQTYYLLQKDIIGEGDTNDTYDTPQIRSSQLYQYDNDHVSSVMQAGAAIAQNYSLSLTGGSKNITYSGVVGYNNTDGVVINTGYERLSLRTNITYKTKNFKLTQGISYFTDCQQKESGDSFTSAMKIYPYYASVTRDMTSYVLPTEAESSSQASVVAKLLRTFNTQNIIEKNSFSYNAGVDLDITKELSLTGKISFGTLDVETFNKVPEVSVYNQNGYEFELLSVNSYISNTSTRRNTFSAYGGINYTKNFAKAHSLSVNALVSSESETYEGFTAKKYGLICDSDVLNAGTMRTSAESVNGYEARILGLIARAQYSYKGKYMLSSSIRADASSKFSASNRWGYFPSLAAAWNMSEESFFEPINDVVSNLKLRASYGTTGNQNVSSYSYQFVVVNGYDYVFDTTSYGYTAVEYANHDIKWETTKQLNGGIDLSLLHNKFTITADYYYTNKEDMLATVSIPSSAGAGASAKMTQNIGDMVNRGLELGVIYRQAISKNLHITANGNFYRNRNEIVDLGSTNIIYGTTEINGEPVTAFIPGEAAGSFYLYRHVGVIKTEEQLEVYQKYVSTAQIGDMMYADLNNDGTIDDSDKMVAGCSFPDFEIGFGFSVDWKRWNFSTQWFSSVGNDIMNGVETSAYENQRAKQLTQMWTPTNSNSNIPTWRTDSNNYNGASDVWLEDGSYLRLRNLNIGYTISKVDIPHVSSINIYLSGQNLLTFTNYSGMDPEVGGNGLSSRGIDLGQYPVSRKYMAGVKVNF